jgi:carbon-monoxide dehydrogenase small subunit
MDKMTLQLAVNQKSYERVIPTRMTLADFLRHELELTGTHVGCEHGVCGACTVLFDGRSARSCLMLAVQAHGHDVTTIEGLAGDESPQMNRLQQAFMGHHALQCGFCTPGMLATLTEYLDANPDTDEAGVREALSGNLCRCTGYENIVNAALAAAAAAKAEVRTDG